MSFGGTDLCRPRSTTRQLLIIQPYRADHVSENRVIAVRFFLRRNRGDEKEIAAPKLRGKDRYDLSTAGNRRAAGKDRRITRPTGDRGALHSTLRPEVGVRLQKFVNV